MKHQNSPKQVLPATLEWYVEASRKLRLTTPRCPFATAKLCPRYYSTLGLFGMHEVTEKVSKEQETKLDAHWNKSTLFDSKIQVEPQVWLRGTSITSWLNCCPEIVFEAWKVFATSGRHFSDSNDRDLTHRELESQRVPKQDPRWRFEQLEPTHYHECREFSVLYHVGSAKGRSTSISSRGRSLPPERKWKILHRDNYTCQYCGRKPPEVQLHVDHKISIHNNGSNDDSNLTTSCSECNLGKGKQNA